MKLSFQPPEEDDPRDDDQRALEAEAPVQPLKQWKVIRHIREEFFVEANTKAEALLNIQDPHTVTVTKQTCVRA